ncbi:MAG: metalloregulator ArsR/SmtB family transcription factor [Planctomycetales bacterium]|nr:metalloregulator ArsR/SmtB family transcription factor [Planctomycetales bacterium]
MVLRRRPRVPLPLAAKLFRGLADSSRLGILLELRRGPRNVSEIVGATGLSQPNVSSHLSCLWCCGLVEKATRGRFVFYRIRSRRTLRILHHAERLLRSVGAHIEACERYEADGEAPRRAAATRRAVGATWA